jgi:hypothetical protein
MTQESSVCSDNQNTDDIGKEVSYSDWEEITRDNNSQPQRDQSTPYLQLQLLWLC